MNFGHIILPQVPHFAQHVDAIRFSKRTVFNRQTFRQRILDDVHGPLIETTAGISEESEERRNYINQKENMNFGHILPPQVPHFA